MNFTPQLVQTTVQEIPPGHLFVSQNDEGVEVIYLMLVQGSDTSQITAVQMLPQPTTTSWSTALPPDRIACDVTDSYVLTYEPAVDNFQFVDTEFMLGPNPATTPAHMTTGQLAILEDRTCLVVLGINPAIGYGLVDIETGEFLLPAAPFPEIATVVQRWSLTLMS